MEFANKIAFTYETLDDAFPTCDPGFAPYGSRVLVQVRSPKTKTAGGIQLTEEVKETELWNTQVAKVIGVGPVAFKNRSTLVPWPEGAWCEVGAFVRIPKYAGDKSIIKASDGVTDVLLIAFNDLDLLGGYHCDPTTIKAFI